MITNNNNDDDQDIAKTLQEDRRNIVSEHCYDCVVKKVYHNNDCLR